MTDPRIADIARRAADGQLGDAELTRIIRDGTTEEQVAAGLVEIYED